MIRIVSFRIGSPLEWFVELQRSTAILSERCEWSCKVFVKCPPFCKDEVKSWSLSMPMTKFEGYNASDVRLGQRCQKKLAGAGVRRGLAGHVVPRLVQFSRVQWLDRRGPPATPGGGGGKPPNLPRRFPGSP